MPSIKMTGRFDPRLALLAVAVPALVFAGYKVYLMRSEQTTRAQPPPGAGAQSVAAAIPEMAANSSESDASRSRVSIYESGSGASSRSIVALGMPYSAAASAPFANTRAGLLQRELLRQALLIAARDELGLMTRDEVLGERYSSLKPAKPGPEVLSIPGPDGRIRLVIRQSAESESETLLDRDLTKTDPEDGDGSNREDLTDLTVQAEELSRTELPAVLRKLGLDGKPSAIKADGAVPEAIENRLGSLGFTDVFAAIKDLHALIRSDGQSPARIGALVRGYAMLGLLSEFQWHPAHKAYKARSLLYAQRLVAREPNGTWGLWHRAFAEALVGLHKDALTDLELADARSKKESKPGRPTWADLVGALARCDAKGLESKGGPHAKLAALARMTILEFPALPNVTLPAASDVIKLEPDCYRAIDAMCAIRAVSSLHVVTLLGPQTLEQVFPQKLKALQSLPAAVRASLEKSDGGSLELATLLEQAGGSPQDTGELSWSALGHLVRETQFVHVYRRLFFMKRIWNVPVEEFWAEARPSIAGHPLEVVLESFALAPRPARTPTTSGGRGFYNMNAEPTATELMKVAGNATPAQYMGYPLVITSHADRVVRDISLEIRNGTEMGGAAGFARSGRLLLSVSPHSQYAKATLIEQDWDFAKSHLAEWEKEAGGSPTLLGALARSYDKLGKADEAERLLADYIKLSPDYWAYEKLAASYKKKGNEARWLEVLEQFLVEGGDPGLDQARVRVEIANHYMRQKNWEKARPYADAAAQTGAGWAMICAQDCAEGRQDYEQAEQWARATSERYPDHQWDRWYILCVKTGKGEVEAARALARQWAEANAQSAQPDLLARVAWFYLGSGEPTKALPILRKVYTTTPSTVGCAQAWIVADMIDDRATRDEYFKYMETRHRPESPHTAALWQLFHQALDRDGGGSLDLKAVEKEHEGAKPNSLWLPDFMVGMFLMKHGKEVDARRYLEKSAENPYNFGWILAVTRDKIRKLDQAAKAAKAQTKAAKR